MTYCIKQYIPILSFLLALLLPSCHEDEPPTTPDPTDKTLILYFPWSSDLSFWISGNITDIEHAIEERKGLNGERVLMYRAVSEDSASLCEISYNKMRGYCEQVPLKSYKQLSATTPTGIAAILSDIRQAAPAGTYAMVVGCHGMGWIPVGSDNSEMKSQSITWKSTQHSQIPMTRYFGGLTPEFQTDISSLAKGIADAGMKMEYILFDDCYMSSVEVAYELRHATDHLIACPTEIMAYGMPYQEITAHLLGGKPNYKAICDEFYDFYTSYAFPYGTIAVTDCRELDELALIMREINSRYTLMPEDTLTLQRMDGLQKTLFFDLGDYVDHLCASDPTLLKAFRDQLQLAVPYSTHTDQFFSTFTNRYNDITSYSGLTTSAPSRNAAAAKWQQTSWYKATH